MSKKDKRRLARRRADQKRHAEQRRAQRRRTEALQQAVSEVLDEFRRAGIDDSVPPDAFAHLVVTHARRRPEPDLPDEPPEGLSPAPVGNLSPGLPGAAHPDSSSEEILPREIGALLAGSAERALEVGEAIGRKAGGSRALELAEVLEARAPDAPVSRWWAAGICAGSGDLARAETLARTALDEEADPEVRSLGSDFLGWLLIEGGNLVGAADLAFEMCTADPEDREAQSLLARSLSRIVRRAEEGGPGSEERCPCGSEQRWTRCCRHAEEARLRRFADRQPLYDLRQAVERFVDNAPDLAAWQMDEVDRFMEEVAASSGSDALDELDDLDEEFRALLGDGSSSGAAPRVTDVYRDLAVEACWTRGPMEDGADDTEGDHHSILNRFARDDRTPERLGTLARSWQDHVRFGIWQVADPEPTPGVWVTELVTRDTLYVAFPPEQIDRLARWSVLLGCFLPDGGAWRSGASFRVLDPDDGDRAAELARHLGHVVLHGLAAEKGLGDVEPLDDPPELDDVPPHGVLAELADPIDPFLARLHYMGVGCALSRILGAVEAARGSGPRITNTDGHPIELYSVQAWVERPDELRRALARRPEFDEEPDGGRLVWRGRVMDDHEMTVNRAQLREYAASLGTELEDTDGPRHWIRGFLEITDHQLRIEVNSEERLRMIERVLSREGVEDLVVESRFEPAMDLPVPRGWRPLAVAESSRVEEAWRQSWLDTELPALDGRSPRQAAKDAIGSVRLERLLRRMEFDEDTVRLLGRRPIDVSRIRAELDGSGRQWELL